MLWPRVVFLLLLPLGLGVLGTFRTSSLLRRRPLAVMSLFPQQDDLPTPRLFRIEYSSESPD